MSVNDRGRPAQAPSNKPIDPGKKSLADSSTTVGLYRGHNKLIAECAG
jgi:hypothetical protein